MKTTPSSRWSTMGWLLCTALLAACHPLRMADVPANITVSSAWQDAPLLAEDNEWGAFDHHLATDAQGHTLAVWEQFDGQRFNVWANRKMRGQGWGVAQLIEAHNAGSAYNPRVAVDSQGNALAVWQQLDGARWRIAANRYMVGTGWSQAAWIDTPQSREAHAPQVGFDRQGNAIAVWQYKDGQRTRIAASRMAASGGWSPAAPIDSGHGYASAPHLARDTQGSMTAVWLLQASKGITVQTSRYLAGGGWTGAAQLQTVRADTAYPPAIIPATLH